MRNFESIAVRDEASGAVVERATGIAPATVLDPCLQFPDEAATPGDGLPQRPYLAVYGHGFSPAFADAIRRRARTSGIPLISIGYRNGWADRQWIDAGPHEFAGFIAGAEAVATNFFHGCVFALRHRRPFACEASWYRCSKLHCLLAQVGGERHLLSGVSPAAACDALLDAPPSDAIAARIDGRRHASQRYLDGALAPERRYG